MIGIESWKVGRQEGNPDKHGCRNRQKDVPGFIEVFWQVACHESQDGTTNQEKDIISKWDKQTGHLHITLKFHIRFDIDWLELQGYCWPYQGCCNCQTYLKIETKVSISWLYSCNKSSYIRSVYSQCHMNSMNCTEQNVNNQTLTQVSQLFVSMFPFVLRQSRYD